MAYRELAGSGHGRARSNSGSSSVQVGGNAAGSTGGSVEATLTTIRCSSCAASATRPSRLALAFMALPWRFFLGKLDDRQREADRGADAVDRAGADAAVDRLELVTTLFDQPPTDNTVITCQPQGFLEERRAAEVRGQRLTKLLQSGNPIP